MINLILSSQELKIYTPDCQKLNQVIHLIHKFSGDLDLFKYLKYDYSRKLTVY